MDNSYPETIFERSIDVLNYKRNALDVIFAPKTVAMIGASDTVGSVGRTILWNLISSPFGGTVFPVNLKRDSVLGIKAYPTIGAVPGPVDLAVIVTPAHTVPGIIGECVDAGVRGAIIISAGFKETGEAGARLEEQIMEHVRRASARPNGGIRIIGPNCLGVMNPRTGLNATFAAAIARPGKVAFISQSGALLTAVLDWSFRENVGFSSFVSIGSMLDVGWGDLIDYLSTDTRTESIVIYMESIGDARAFLSAAREVALTKPIIVIKPGRSAAAAKAAASHTGSLTGSDDVLEVAFRRAGALRVETISDLFYLAEVFSKQPRPRGPNLTILTNAGGPGVLATDALIAEGGQLAQLSEETYAALNKLLPAAWSHNNPVDILGDASPERYSKALEIAAKDPASDGLLVILTPQAMTDPTLTAEQLKPYAKIPGKPILASWMGGTEVEAGETILNRADIPTFGYPDTAARVFEYMWRYTDNLHSLYETPEFADEQEQVDRARAAEIIATARAKGRTLLTEVESKQLLAAYGIPTVETRVATSVEDAVSCADAMGYPVVLKVHSETITHKTDVGGVKLNLKDAAAVRAAFREIEESVREKAGSANKDGQPAFLGVTVQPMVKLDGYELILGSSIDSQFGPVLLFGLGGQLVEVFKDRALGLPPLNTTLARRMMERTKIYTALKGVRGRAAVDLDGLVALLVRFSQLVAEQPWIKELDINPLLAKPVDAGGSPDGKGQSSLLALDARVIVFGMDTREQDLPRLAIPPYPIQYVKHWTAKDGSALTIRPIRPEDEPLMVKYHRQLSERSVYLRYLHPIALDQRIAHERLSRICFIDYDREMALVAERTNPQTKEQEILGVGRLSKIRGTADAEFAILVVDAFQGMGLGSEFLKQLIQIGRDEHLERIVAYISPENYAMQTVSKKLGFKLHHSLEDQIVDAELVL